MSYKSQVLTECAMSIALSSILSFIPIFKIANGGSITLASTAPIIMFSFTHSYYWSLIAGFIYSIFQLLYGFHFPPSKTIFSFLVVIFLDYIISYTSLGLPSFTKHISKNKYFNIFIGIVLSFFTRLGCSTISGIVVWRDYFPSNVPVWIYSIIYNLSYLFPEYIITAIVCLITIKFFDKNNI